MHAHFMTLKSYVVFLLRKTTRRTIAEDNYMKRGMKTRHIDVGVGG
jgi:hypothetical protein